MRVQAGISYGNGACILRHGSGHRHININTTFPIPLLYRGRNMHPGTNLSYSLMSSLEGSFSSNPYASIVVMPVSVSWSWILGQ